MALANSNTIICHLLPGPHLYTWVESSNVDKLRCWRTKVPRRWWDSNTGSQRESRVNTPIYHENLQLNCCYCYWSCVKYHCGFKLSYLFCFSSDSTNNHTITTKSISIEGRYPICRPKMWHYVDIMVTVTFGWIIYKIVLSLIFFLLCYKQSVSKGLH